MNLYEEYLLIPDKLVLRKQFLAVAIYHEATYFFPKYPLEQWLDDALQFTQEQESSFAALYSYLVTELLPMERPLTKAIIHDTFDNYIDSIQYEMMPLFEQLLVEEVPVEEVEAPLFEDEHIIGTLNSDFRLVRDVVTTKKAFTEIGDGILFSELHNKKGELRGRAEFRPEDLPLNNPEQQALWMRTVDSTISTFDEMTADLLDLISHLWLYRAKDEDGYIEFHSDDALKLRFQDPSKEKGTIRERERFKVMQRVTTLSNLWISMRDDKVRVVDANQIKKDENYDFTTYHRMFNISAMEMAHDAVTNEPMGIYSIRVQPAPILRKYLDSTVENFGLLSLKIFQYSHFSQREHKRLLRYLSYHWKIRTVKRSIKKPFKVSTIVEALNFAPSYNRVKIRERLEQVLEDLQKDGVIHSWRYTEPIQEELVGKKGWFTDYWCELGLYILPPDDVIEENKKKITVSAKGAMIDVKTANTGPKTMLRTQKPKVEKITLSPEHLNDLIDRKQLSIRAAAKEMDMSHSTLIRYLNRQGKRFSHKNMAKIEEWFDTHLYDEA